MFLDRRLMGTIDVRRPLPRIAVQSLAELRKKIEFQMIVRVDQTGQYQVIAEIKRFLAAPAREGNAPVADKQITTFRANRIQRDSRTRNLQSCSQPAIK